MLARLRLLFRVLVIARVLVHYRLDQDFLCEHPLRFLLAPLRLFGRCNASLTRGERLRSALIQLGPIFIKFGQMLSTRRDLLPPDLADALAHLQDRVPPFNSAAAQAGIESALGQAVSELFRSFESEALASASVAQVHAATLKDGREVVVKIIRPGIRPQIEQDLALMARLARLFERLHIDGPRLRPQEIVEDYRHTLLDELDLRIEAANTAALKRNFANSELLYVPEVHWDFVRESVMVCERIHGIPISDIAALNAAGVDMAELAARGVQIFFTQVFRDRFFHADMHPGNIFVDVRDPKKPRYIAIDCAIMGSLAETDQVYLAENFLAFFNRDYRRIAELHVESGWVPAGTSVEQFESAVRANCEPIFGKPLAGISFGQFLLQLFQTARRFNMSVQPQLVLLQKTLFYIEGLGRQLYPPLDLWQTAKPFLDDWQRQRLHPKALFKAFAQRIPLWTPALPTLPEKLLAALNARATAGDPAETLRQLRLAQRRDARVLRAQLRQYAGVALLLTAASAGALKAEPLWVLAALLGVWWAISGFFAAKRL